MMRLSVLICTYNRHDLLRQALTALIDGTAEKPDQVVIVNGGDERADQVVEAFVGRHGVEVKLIRTVNKNLATSRNVGLPHCTGDIVAMTDDDAEVFPDWVTQLKRQHVDHPEAGVIGGQVIGSDSGSQLLSRLADLVTFPLPSEPGYVQHNLPGVNVSYKRTLLDQIGLQDETLFRGEDVDFNWRIKQLGAQLYFHPDIKVIHHHRPSLRQFWRQHYMYGRAYYLVRRKWQPMYSVYPRQLRTPRDVLKAGYFVVAIVIQPAQAVGKLSSWRDRLLGYPILLVNHALWKYGMIRQWWLEKRRVSP
jgi:GT2 family glycosyltransferase